MRLEKLRQVDLNLLITFAAIAEERSITAAASRLLLSQPAVSRALQRARAMFQDDLLVRSPQGFELTLRGRKILQELEGLLPRMENLVTPSLFDPKREKSHFRISGPDNVCTVVLPRLCRQYGEGYQVQFEFLPWQAGISELVERGQLDLILHIDDGLLPVHFHTERLYREDWVCAVARGKPLWRPTLAKAVLGSEPHCGCYLWRRADNSRQATRSSRCETQFLNSSTLLRCGFAMPTRYRTGADLNHWYDLGRQTESRPAPRKSTTGVASVLFLDGMASKAEQRSAAYLAASSRAISGRGSY
jgi:DNA-binding transcriptional LysR family regulator